ncbi:unnamed protein product, partial [Symbiodinium microadriaticum]
RGAAGTSSSAGAAKSKAATAVQRLPQHPDAEFLPHRLTRPTLAHRRFQMAASFLARLTNYGGPLLISRSNNIRPLGALARGAYVLWTRALAKREILHRSAKLDGQSHGGRDFVTARSYGAQESDRVEDGVPEVYRATGLQKLPIGAANIEVAIHVLTMPKGLSQIVGSQGSACQANRGQTVRQGPFWDIPSERKRELRDNAGV